MREVALEPFDFFGSRLFREELVEHPPQVLSFEGALDRLEALANQIEPAMVELLRLAQDLLRDRYLPKSWRSAAYRSSRIWSSERRRSA
jgi:hypothetical protein